MTRPKKHFLDRIGAAIRFCFVAPLMICVILISRQRVLRFLLSVLYCAVIWPVALWARCRGAECGGWHGNRPRPGWRRVDISSMDKSVYEGEQ
jgi:hypothetical protein